MAPMIDASMPALFVQYQWSVPSIPLLSRQASWPQRTVSYDRLREWMMFGYIDAKSRTVSPQWTPAACSSTVAPLYFFVLCAAPSLPPPPPGSLAWRSANVGMSAPRRLCSARIMLWIQVLTLVRETTSTDSVERRARVTMRRITIPPEYADSSYVSLASLWQYLARSSGSIRCAAAPLPVLRSPSIASDTASRPNVLYLPANAYAWRDGLLNTLYRSMCIRPRVGCSIDPRCSNAAPASAPIPSRTALLYMYGTSNSSP